MSPTTVMNGVHGLGAPLKTSIGPPGMSAWYTKQIKSNNGEYLYLGEVLDGQRVFAWQCGPLEVSGAIGSKPLPHNIVEFKASLVLPITGKVDVASASGVLNVDSWVNVKTNFDIKLAAGYVELCLNGPTEVWMKVHLKSDLETGTYQKSFKLMNSF
ncbi:hypothetical protein EIP86_007494 [Pleurotus ostreatoroseus]|nr:hypothetical protein EIP86_007494 [Pleurotus ostreatoroseus]